MKQWLQMIGVAITAVLMLILIVVFSGAFLLLFVVVLALFAVMWVFGTRITVTVRGKKIGYVRWLTFHRYDRPVDQLVE